MMRPLPGSAVSGAVIELEWSIPPSDVSEWWLVIGTTPGDRDLFDSGSLGRQRRLRIEGLGIEGKRFYVRLWYRRGGGWLFEDFSYRAR